MVDQNVREIISCQPVFCWQFVNVYLQSYLSFLQISSSPRQLSPGEQADEFNPMQPFDTDVEKSRSGIPSPPHVLSPGTANRYAGCIPLQKKCTRPRKELPNSPNHDGLAKK
jgi:hypothetical protein